MQDDKRAAERMAAESLRFWTEVLTRSRERLENLTDPVETAQTRREVGENEDRVAEAERTLARAIRARELADEIEADRARDRGPNRGPERER